MKAKHKVVLTHGAALLAGAAIAVAVTYHAPSGAQAAPGAAQTAERHDSQPAARIAISHPVDTTSDQDAVANAFDPITGQPIQSDAAYREWLEREAATAHY